MISVISFAVKCLFSSDFRILDTPLLAVGKLFLPEYQ